MSRSTPSAAPPYAGNEHILALRAAGWSIHQIADSLGASARTVARWSAGYTRPLPTFERELAKLIAAKSP